MHHHLPDELLADHAAGTLTQAVEALAAVHLTLCPACRARMADIESIGGALLEDLPGASLGADALERMLSRLDSEPDNEAAPAEVAAIDTVSLPRPLRRHVGADIEALPWRRLVRGIERARLDLDAGRGSVFLLRGQPGAVLPRHTHEGTEMTLVLTGGFSDQRGHYVRGDIDVTDDRVDHSPAADPGEVCLCMVVLDGALRLTGRVGRLLNPLVR